ncbi:MAG: hypothetical protein ABJB05_02185 [Parafilimonas sp.]
MQKRRFTFLMVLLLCIVIVAGFVFCSINKPHESAENLTANVFVNAEKLYADYSQNEVQANGLYLDKIISVTGKLQQKLNQNDHYFLVLQTNGDGNINCSMMMNDTTVLHQLSLNKVLIIKGKCTGYLADVNLVDCVLTK